jgi:P-type Cu+ transporter
MSCAKCAPEIERALTQLQGVVAARVNYASERGIVTFTDPHVSAAVVVGKLQSAGFDVPVERFVLKVDGLMYATSAQTVERMLNRVEGVVRASVDLRTQRVMVDSFAEEASRAACEREFSGLGMRVMRQPAPNTIYKFVARIVITILLALLSLWSAGAHAGLVQVGPLHAPLVVIVISVLVAYGVGLPFYQHAYDACLRGVLDASVLVALAGSLLLFSGLLMALAMPAALITTAGLVLANGLTAGWFLMRGVALWARAHSQASQVV